MYLALVGFFHILYTVYLYFEEHGGAVISTIASLQRASLCGALMLWWVSLWMLLLPHMV